MKRVRGLGTGTGRMAMDIIIEPPSIDQIMKDVKKFKMTDM